MEIKRVVEIEKIIVTIQCDDGKTYEAMPDIQEFQQHLTDLTWEPVNILSLPRHRRTDEVIRKWAQNNNYDIASRGRIPEDIRQAYYTRTISEEENND